MNARIISTGSYLPRKILTNFDIEKMIETDNEWIVQRTGIRERHIAGDDELPSDLATKAAKNALEKINMDPKEIDLIVLGTLLPDKLLPSTALFVQEKLNAINAFCFDINAACSGFMYSLGIANAYIKSKMVKRVLVIGVEELSKLVDWTDRSTCVIFGDGAACVVLEATEDEDRGILSVKQGSDGSYNHLMHIPALGAKQPCSQKAIDNHDVFIKMKGNETFKLAVRYLVNVSKEALTEARLNFDDVNLLIPHQANIRVIEAFSKRVNIPIEKTIITIDKHGNTSAASIPLALDDAFNSGKIKKNDILLLNSFGASLTWAASAIRW